MRWGTVVLCGGRSRRMGRPKAWLPFGPETLLERTLRIVRSRADGPIIVVTADGQDLPALPGDVGRAIDERPERGPLEGLQAGLAALVDRCDAAYVTSCDVPLLHVDFITAVCRALGPAEAAVPRVDGFLHPLASALRLEPALPRIRELLADDDLRAAALFARLDTRYLDADDLRPADPNLQSLRNVNTPEQYRAALEAAGFAAE